MHQHAENLQVQLAVRSKDAADFIFSHHFKANSSAKCETSVGGRQLRQFLALLWCLV